MEPIGHYEEIEPYCKWQKNKDSEIVEIHIRGFRKENLRVQLTNAGFLVITGERGTDQTGGVKFRKEIKVPDYCARNEIRAKLTGGVLYITMPKKSALTDTKAQNYLPDQLNQEQTGKRKLEELAGPSDDSKTWRERYMFGLKPPPMDKKSAWKLRALTAVVVVVSVGAYIAYKYHKSLHADN